MHLLIYESDPGGHRLNYVRLLVSFARNITERVTIAVTPGAVETAEFKTHVAPTLAEHSAELRAEIPEHPGVSLAVARRRGAAFIELVRSHRPDHVWLPSGDGLIQGWGALSSRARRLPAGCQVEAGLHRVSWAYPARSWKGGFKTRVSGMLAERAGLSLWNHVDPIGYDWFLRHRPRQADRHRVIPDPIEVRPAKSKADSRRALGLPEDGRYVVNVGLLDERKGVNQLVEGFLRAGLNDNDRLLLIGKCSDGLTALLGRSGVQAARDAGRIVVLSGYQPLETLLDGLAAADLVCTPHQHHVGISSVVLRATAAGRPVLTPAYGWFGRMVEPYGLGVTRPLGDADEVASALPGVLDEVVDWTPGPAAQELLAFNSLDNFERTWSFRAAERAGLSPALPRPWVNR